MSQIIRLPANNWQPRDYQKPAWKAWHTGCNHLELVWHRRSGKDDIALHGTAIKAMERPATYWHMLPLKEQARKAIWEAVNPHTGMKRIDEAFPREIRATTRENEMFIKFKNGSTWQVLGSDNFEGSIGSPPAGIVYSEWAQAKPSCRAYLRPILAENGGWQLFITTPRGKNHAHKTYNAALKNPNAFAQKLDAEQTGVLTLDQLAYERQAYIDDYGEAMGKALYEQEWLVSFEAAILGAYYGEECRAVEKSGRLCEFEHDPDFPVHTVWDLGHDDDCVILFYQVIHGEVRLLEYISESFKDLSFYVSQITGIETEINVIHGKVVVERGAPIKELAHRHHYRIGTIWIPHDGKAKTLAAAGKSVEIQLGAVFGVNNVRLVPNLSIQDGIQAARQLFKRCYFHMECLDVLETIKQYRREWDDGLKMFKDKPLHDWTSHIADAFRYLAVVWTERRPAKDEKPPPPKGLEGMSLNDLWKQQKPKRKRI